MSRNAFSCSIKRTTRSSFRSSRSALVTSSAVPVFMIAAGVPLEERNRRGRWAPGSRTADVVYDRPEIVPEDDPLSKVPIGGHKPSAA